MTLTAKDVVATVLTALTVLVFATTHERWNVALVGDSHRWAAGAVFVLGIATCALGRPARDATSKALMLLGIAALALAVLAVSTGSLTALSLLVLDTVVLWAVATLRHLLHPPARPVVT